MREILLGTSEYVEVTVLSEPVRATHGTVGDVVVDREKNELLGMQFEVLKFFHKFFSCAQYSGVTGWNSDAVCSAKPSANPTRMLFQLLTLKKTDRSADRRAKEVYHRS